MTDCFEAICTESLNNSLMYSFLFNNFVCCIYTVYMNEYAQHQRVAGRSGVKAPRSDWMVGPENEFE